MKRWYVNFSFLRSTKKALLKKISFLKDLELVGEPYSSENHFENALDTLIWEATLNK